MKKLLVTFLFVTSFVNAQFFGPKQQEGLMNGGFGMTWIDGQPFYAVHLMPEVAFSNIGIGLNLNLEFGSNGKIRTENFNEFSDYASIIRYIRYGQKKDPLYVRLGSLDYATLGHGSIMYMYNNSPSYDARKIGLEFDADFNNFGFESVYGTFGEGGVFGLRGYVRPLQFTSAGDIPIIGNLEAGLSYVTDFNKNSGVIAGTIDPVSGKFKSSVDEGNVSALGFDLGLPIVRASIFNWDLYYDYVKFIDFGNGSSIGTVFNFHGLGLVDLNLKFERRINGDGYLPSYFNSLYEIERFRFNPATSQVSSKVQILKAQAAVGNGYYGELLVSVLNTFNILGSYQRLDDMPQSGILHMSTEVAPDGVPFILRAGYDKANIKNEKDLFTLDDRSYLFTEVGYKPLPYLITSIVYHYTFTPIRDAGDNIITYKSQKKIEPRVSFVYPFGL